MLIHLSHCETRRSIPVLYKEVGRWCIHNLTHSCTSSSERNRRLRISFFRSQKMWKSQRERSGLYGGCWSVSQPNLWSFSLTRLAVWGRALSCRRMIPYDSIPGRYDFMARRNNLSHQETNHTFLFFSWLHFQCWTNTRYTTLTSRAIKKQFSSPVVFTMHVSYPTYGSIDTSQQCCQLLRGMCFIAGVRFSFDCRLYICI